MRLWASWTAKTAVFSLAAGLAATAAGSAAWAAPGSGASVARGASGSTALPVRGGAIGSGQVTGQTALAGDVCRDAGALLGVVGAACQSMTLVASPAPAPAQGAVRNSGRDLAATVGQVIQRAVVPVTAVLSPGGSGPALSTAPLTAVGGAPSSRSTGADGVSAPGTDRTSSPPAARAGDTNVPAATQLAGLGALPGLADLPSAGPASTPARNGAPGGGIPMPGTALSAASSGVSSDSFAVLAVGALLAGASALKIAGRRSRDRKAGLE